MPVIFFDIGQTLATAELDANKRLTGFKVLPGVLETLNALRQRSLPMGIISDRGTFSKKTVLQALDNAGLRVFFDPRLIIFAQKNSPQPFQRAANKAGVSPAECFFVGEDPEERSHASTAGFAEVIATPAHVLSVLDGEAIHFASLWRTGETGTEDDAWSKAFSNPALLPLRISNNPRRTEVLTTTSVLDHLRVEGFQVQQLGNENDPRTKDLFLIRDDRSVPAGFTSAETFSTDFLGENGWQDLVVGSTNEGLLIALPAGVSIDELHFPGALHGHNELLIPDRSLLASLLNMSASKSLVADAGFAPVLGDQELDVLRGITPAIVQELHEPYIGVAPLAPSQSGVVSRHIQHADNRRVSDALVRHLAQLGGPQIVVRRHPFKFQGLRLENVEAEFSGELPNSFVLLTAHLDATAKDGAGFDPATDPAPGADDDASGVAAVLAAVRAIAQLRQFKNTKRSIRFVLFNAEEQGLVGSKEYAKAQAEQQVDIAAVFQMDMIGFRKPGPNLSRNFEAHAGFAVAPAVEERSLATAQLVHHAVSQVSPNLDPPQIFPPGPGGPDPASGRSDHSSFQQRGYAACVLCEDFFVGPGPDAPEPQNNLNYHKPTDTQIDYQYAADIARAVTGAALIAAQA